MPIAFHPETRANHPFWLSGLHLARYPELAELAADGPALAEVFEALWAAPVDRAVAQELLVEWGPDAPGVQHLVALAWFIEEKSLRALKDTARRALPEAVLRDHPALKSRCHRRATAALLLRHAPDALAEVFAWDLYHPRARAALKMANQRRKLPIPLVAVPWADHAEAALDDLTHARTRRGLRFERAVVRPWADDALLVFREYGRPDTHRDADDEIAPGWRDDWTFVRFHERGARVDVTSRDPERAKALASAVGSRLFGATVTYRHARDPLTRERLDAFLARLLDPDDPVFFLHEIAAGMDAYHDQPHAVLGRWGSGRIEEVACALRDAHGFARDSTLVDHAKIAFLDEEGAHHRMTLCFPERTDLTTDLALSFQDSGVATDVAERFAARLQGELGVEVHPRVPDPTRTRRSARSAGKPERTGLAEWAGVLSPRMDHPAHWQRVMLEEVDEQGLILVTREAVFRCGDTRIPAPLHPPGSVGCPGEVTMPYGSMSREDGFTQDPGEVFRCDHGGHAWKLGGYGPSCILRVRTRVDLDRAGAWLRCQLGAARWEEDEPGVFTKLVPGRGRRTLVVLDEAGSEWHAPGAPRTAWLALDNRTDIRAYGAYGLTLAHLVCDGVAAIPRVFGDEAATIVLLVSEAPEATYDRRKRIEPDEAGILVEGNVAIPRSQGRFRLLFALLQRWASRHADDDIPLATFGQLAALDVSATLATKDLHTLVHDLGKELGPLSDEILDRQGRKGLRLGSGYRVTGFDLDDELADFKDRVRHDR